MMIFISDPTLTAVNVAKAMELMNNWNIFTFTTIEDNVISRHRLQEIQSKCFTKREIASECAFYYVHCHPQPSWTHLASHLYIWGEFAAVEKLKPFLPLRGKCNCWGVTYVKHFLRWGNYSYCMWQHTQIQILLSNTC